MLRSRQPNQKNGHGGESPKTDAAGGKDLQNENRMKIKRKTPPDVIVRSEGTVFLCPLTPRAKEWIDENVQADAMWFGTDLVVEHRYAWGLAVGMKDAGFELA